MRITLAAAIVFGLAFSVSAQAQTVFVYEPVPAEKIAVTASSSFPGFDPENTSNGEGLERHRHRSHNLGNGMWISRTSKHPTQAHANTAKGVVWLLYTLDEPQSVDLVEIWNHNQLNHLNRGLKKVYLQHSIDGENWTSIRIDGTDAIELPKSGGEHLAPPTFQVNLSGVEFKYFCITADTLEGNHYRDGRAETLENARIHNQDIDYYGLSEVRFYTKTKKRVRTLPVVDDVSYIVSQGYQRSVNGPRREYRVELDVPLYAGARVTVKTAQGEHTDNIPTSAVGIYSYSLVFPPGMMEEAEEVTFEFASPQGTVSQSLNVPPARQWTVYFLPHSHLDIGYTHPHEDVMELQLRNIDLAIRLIEDSRHLPEASQFRWNIETMWPVVEFRRRYRHTAKWDVFADAVRSGHIGLNASIGNILTGLCKQEELMHLFDDGIAIGRELGVNVNTVMMSDVPGFSWGVVTAMAHNGLKYFSMAPNFVPHLLNGGSRVGLAHIEWADRPFYWQSQSGDDQVLCWSAGTGYSYFHDWLAGPLSSAGLSPVWEYLNKLEAKAFPYNTTYFRYTVNGDNGPPDEEMASLIQRWNETYASPHFVIGTTEQLFTAFEAQYKDYIPTFKGDFTPYWEDGAASTASMLSKNRRNADRLNQLEILWSMTQPSAFPFDTFRQSWRNVVLFSEHTWGASASGPAPEAPLTQLLWKQKQGFALTADSLADVIEYQFQKHLTAGSRQPRLVEVFNTNLWPRTDVVTLSTEYDLTGYVLRDSNGETLPLQKVRDGEWIFVARDIPAMSSKVFKLVESRKPLSGNGSLFVRENTLGNAELTVEVDVETGGIAALTSRADGKNYASGAGLNTYLYSGRNAENFVVNAQVRELVPVHTGPVSSTLRVVSEPPGTHSLTQDITVYEGIRRVDIRNTVDKTKSYEFENLRFVFPFDIPNAETEIDIPFSLIRPEREQLSGANKNFFSIHNGVAITGLKHSALLTTIDAPILELGKPEGEGWMVDRREYLMWKRQASSSPTLFSWVMNNSWRTNYKASQEGLAVFEYSIIPLGGDSPEAKRKAFEIAHPLRGFLSDRPHSLNTLFRLKGTPQVAVSTLRPASDGSGYIVRLTNLSDRSLHTGFEWTGIQPVRVQQCTNQEEVREEINSSSFWMKPYGTLTLKLTTK